MAQFTEEMLEEMKATGIISFATASKDGTPNVVPVGMIFMGDDGNIWLVDNYLNKTLANLKENPKAAFYIWTRDPSRSRTPGPIISRRSGSLTPRRRRTLLRTSSRLRSRKSIT